MEQQNLTQESPLFGLSIDPVIKSHLSETARWGKFLAIVGFIMCGIIVLAGIALATTLGSVDRTYGNDLGPSFGRTFGSAFIVIYILIAILYFFPCLFLLRFSNKMKTALAADNQADLTYSFQNLKVLFRYVGVLMIIVLAFYAIALLFGGLGMMMGR
jgi:hypothetical protein